MNDTPEHNLLALLLICKLYLNQPLPTQLELEQSHNPKTGWSTEMSDLLEVLTLQLYDDSPLTFGILKGFCDIALSDIERGIRWWRPWPFRQKGRAHRCLTNFSEDLAQEVKDAEIVPGVSAFMDCLSDDPAGHQKSRGSVSFFSPVVDAVYQQEEDSVKSILANLKQTDDPLKSVDFTFSTITFQSIKS